jgi:hypothetical protein
VSRLERLKVEGRGTPPTGGVPLIVAVEGKYTLYKIMKKTVIARIIAVAGNKLNLKHMT